MNKEEIEKILDRLERIDHNKLNNNIDNLEYVTQKYNILDAWNNGLCENVRKKAKENIKNAIDSEKIKVNQYNKNNELIKQWNYIREAEKELNINNANIVSCCKNKRKTAGGYIWRYSNEMC